MLYQHTPDQTEFPAVPRAFVVWMSDPSHCLVCFQDFMCVTYWCKTSLASVLVFLHSASVSQHVAVRRHPATLSNSNCLHALLQSMLTV